jgi:hypothetical protein
MWGGDAGGGPDQREGCGDYYYDGERHCVSSKVMCHLYGENIVNLEIRNCTNDRSSTNHMGRLDVRMNQHACETSPLVVGDRADTIGSGHEALCRRIQRH